MELFSIPLDGSLPPTKLNGPLITGGDVSPVYRFSPDSAFVVYRADQEQSQLFELYYAPIDGTATARKLNGAVSSRGVDEFRVRPDSAGVVYTVDSGNFQDAELHHALFGGPPGQSLAGALTSRGDVEVSPDSSLVVFVSPSGEGVFALSLDGGSAAEQLNTTLPAGEEIDVSGFEIAGDGSRVAYFVRKDSGLTRELFSVPLTPRASKVDRSCWRTKAAA